MPLPREAPQSTEVTLDSAQAAGLTVPVPFGIALLLAHIHVAASQEHPGPSLWSAMGLTPLHLLSF